MLRKEALAAHSRILHATDVDEFDDDYQRMIVAEDNQSGLQEQQTNVNPFVIDKNSNEDGYARA